MGEMEPSTISPGCRCGGGPSIASAAPDAGRALSCSPGMDRRSAQKSEDPACPHRVHGQVRGRHRLPAARIHDGHHRLHQPLDVQRRDGQGGGVQPRAGSCTSPTSPPSSTRVSRTPSGSWSTGSRRGGRRYSSSIRPRTPTSTTPTSGRSMRRPRSWASSWISIPGSAGCRRARASTALPLQLDDVARDFPELKINAFHMGYPYCDDLNMVAMGHPNVYVCLSLLIPWAITAPRKFAKILGEAMRFVGPDRIIWGTDYAGYGAQIKAAVQGPQGVPDPRGHAGGVRYPALTDEDRKGRNLRVEPGQASRYRTKKESLGGTAQWRRRQRNPQ